MMIVVLTVALHATVFHAGELTAPPLVDAPAATTAQPVAPDTAAPEDNWQLAPKPATPPVATDPAVPAARPVPAPALRSTPRPPPAPPSAITPGLRVILELGSSLVGELALGAGFALGGAALAGNAGNGSGALTALLLGGIAGVFVGSILGPVIADIAVGHPIGSLGAALGGTAAAVIGFIFFSAISGSALGGIVLILLPALGAVAGAELAIAMAGGNARHSDLSPPRSSSTALVQLARF